MTMNKILILICGLLFLGQIVFAQNNDKIQVVAKQQAELIDLFQMFKGGKTSGITAEDASARIDNLINKVNENPNNKGYLIVYCGKSCQYGEVEAHIRGIKLKLNFRNANKNQLIILSGGYQEVSITELWFVPENSCLPKPNSTVDIQDVIFKGLFKRKVVYYDCC